MLVSEVYATILRNLSRDELDLLQQVDVRSYKVVTSRSFKKNGPLRRLNKLSIRRCPLDGKHYYAIRRRRNWRSDDVELDNADDLKARMRFAFIEHLWFAYDCHLSEPLLDVLLPLREAWTNASSKVPKFESPEVRTRALDELFLSQKLLLDASIFRLERKLMSTACMQHCQKLHILEDDQSLVDAIELAAWIQRGNAERQPISVFAQLDNVDLQSLIKALKKTFEKATEPRRYDVLMWSNGTDPGAEDKVYRNKKTLERLEIEFDNMRAPPYFVKIKRVPDENE